MESTPKRERWARAATSATGQPVLLLPLPSPSPLSTPRLSLRELLAGNQRVSTVSHLGTRVRSPALPHVVLALWRAGHPVPLRLVPLAFLPLAAGASLDGDHRTESPGRPDLSLARRLALLGHHWSTQTPLVHRRHHRRTPSGHHPDRPAVAVAVQGPPRRSLPRTAPRRV